MYDETKTSIDEAKWHIDDFLKWTIVCEISGKPFRITKQELVFYIEHGLPLPTKHPDQRHKERMAIRNPRKLHSRRCMNKACKIPDETMYTIYAPDREEVAYCGQCFRDEK